MQHDREAIERARQQGLFDNPFDAQALSLDDEEKSRMARRLAGEKEGAAAPAGKGVAADEEETGRPVSGRGAPPVLSLFERFLFLLQRLFTGLSEEEFYRRRALRLVAAEVRRCRPALYNFASRRVSGEFGELLYRLASQAAGFKRLFDFCHAAETGRGFLEFFVGRLAESLPDLQQRFSLSFIKNNRRLFQEARLQDTVEGEVDRALATVSPDDQRVVNLLYNNLLGFQRLSEFNYYNTLRRFGEKHSAFQDGLPAFAPVPGSELLADLKRLEDLLFSVDPELEMQPVFEAMTAFVRVIDPDADPAALPGWNAEDTRRFYDAIQDLLREDRLSNLIRVIAGDPYHEPRLRLRRTNLFEELRQALLARTLPRAQALLHQVEMDDLNRKVRELFGSEVLAPIEFYNEAMNERLQSQSLPVFTCSRHLQLLKTYYEVLFLPLIKPALQVVVVDGDFLDKRLYTQLSDFFYKFSDAFAAVYDFEKKVSVSSKEGEKLHSLFSRFSGDLPTRKILQERIAFLNNLAAKVLREIAIHLRMAMPACDALLKDIVQAKPEFVVNIKHLGASRNKAILRALVKTVEATKLVLGTIEEFLE